MAGRKTTLLVLTCGVLLTITVAGPLTSWTSALLSPAYVAAANHDRLVELIVRETYAPNILKTVTIIGDLPEMNPCDMELLNVAERKKGYAVDLAYKLIRANDSNYEAAVKAQEWSYSPLRHWTWPQLAAVKGCFDASILGRFCKNYVSDFDRSYASDKRARDMSFQTLQRRTDEIRCADVRYLEPRL